MRRTPQKFLSIFCALLACAVICARPHAADAGKKLLPPEEGVYHAAHPDFGLRDDLVTKGRVRAFVRTAEKSIVWAYVSFHWDKGIEFPVKQCRVLNECGVVPLVGIMPWSTLEQGRAESVYTLERIVRGYFDEHLRQCAEDVKNLGFPVMIEFGPECNGSWFPWSAAWNGRGEDSYGERGWPDGPERFRDAYRHIVDVFREAGAIDVTWVFHIASDGSPKSPKEGWNAARWYYPGDDYVDWIGTSAYGRLRGDDPARSFADTVKHVYPGLVALSETKPIAVLEMGVSEVPALGDKGLWIREAFAAIHEGRYPRLKAVAWWNKTYRPDGTRSTLEIDSSVRALRAYREGVASMRDVAVFSDE
ncbi:beta-mannanase [Synergistaceae bacterium OttesenSCG-928-I11]|nr:beta-mannanase [Synergistaceae bacterium OttesenSCG-928-I11]